MGRIVLTVVGLNGRQPCATLRTREAAMKRAEVLRLVLDEAPECLAVSNLGPVSQELFRVGDRPRNFYMLGSMGLASSVGLGLAMSTDAQVVVIDGDGSVLMNLGTFATIAAQRPQRLLHLVIDNQVHESTGGQPTHTSSGSDLAGIARAAGIASAVCIDTRGTEDAETLRRALRAGLESPGPHVVVVKVDPGSLPDLAPVPYDSDAIRLRFSASFSTAPRRVTQEPPQAGGGGENWAGPALASLAAAGVGLACSVPCRLLAPLVAALDTAPMTHVPVTREEEGVGVCAGAALAGTVPVLVMQNSGLGNCMNGLLSLTRYYHLPLLLLVGHRGTQGERIAAQIPMGSRTRALFAALGITVFDIDERMRFAELGDVARHALLAREPVAALVSPRAVA